MSATEDTVAKPEETKPSEVAPATEAPATDAAVLDPTTAPEVTILSKDPEVVKANLEQAEPVSTKAPEGTSDAPAQEGEPAAAEAPAAAAEKKEGSSLFAFLKKKATDKKAASKPAKAKTESESGPPAASAEPPAAEVNYEKMFEDGYVDFKVHGTFFGGWKSRILAFGKEEGYSQAALAPYITSHKAIGNMPSAEKIAAACDNAAHATVTGAGLMYVKKQKNDAPVRIINLADVTEVTTTNGNFAIKTESLGDYEFGVGFSNKAQAWKAEIEKRVEEAKTGRAAVLENEKYKESLAHFSELHKGHHGKATEPITSDEEGAVSGEEGKRSWTRRISGSFQRITGGTKEAAKEVAPEAPKKDVSPAPAATEEPAAESAPVAEAPVATTETAVVDAPTETPEPVVEKKEKRKSFSGFQGLWKQKAKEAPKETTEDAPVKETTEETAPAESGETQPAPETSQTAPASETPAQPEETPAEPKPEKAKRQSIFAGLLPKKETKEKAVTNGDSEDHRASEPLPEEPEPPAKKDSLSRRLTSPFKSLARAKSPEKGKSTKVSDEAPKIDTQIESSEAAPAEPEVKAEEPLMTTEAPSTTVDAPTSEHASAQVVPTPA